MRIKKFSQKYNLSYDTIRYYIKLNLLVPEKIGGQYFFNEECRSDIEEVLKLKEMEFSLQEIKEILYFKRIGKLTSYQKNNYYQNLFKNKIEDIESRIEELVHAEEDLNKKLDELLSDNYDSSYRMGIDLSALPLFSCPDCGAKLSLSADSVAENQILEGELNCSCGRSLKIKDGILYSFDPAAEKMDLKTGNNEYNHIESYVKTTDSDYMDKTYKGLEWMKREIDFENLKGKVILEPGSGFGFLLRHIYNDLPEDCVYICVDKNPDYNIFLKKTLELSHQKKKIIFINADLPELPLKDNTADYMLDFTGITGYSFERGGFFPELLNDYLKDDIKVLATFIIYHRFGPKNIVPENLRKYFRYQNIKDAFIELGFKIEEEVKSEIEKIDEDIGEYEQFAQIGDQIYSYQLKLRRWS